MRTMLRRRVGPLRFVIMLIMTALLESTMGVAAPPPGGIDYQKFLNDAVAALRPRFHIGRALSSIESDNDHIRAFQHFASNDGVITVEVYRDFEEDYTPPSVFIAVPRHLSDIPTAMLYQWFEYRQDPNSRFILRTIPLSDPPYPPPDVVPPLLGSTQKWCDGKTYDGAQILDGDVDPPHWSPILLRGSDYSQISRLMQSGATQSAAESMLQGAGDSAANEDLTDRVENNLWFTMAARGFVASANFPSGDLARDHATTYFDGNVTPTGSISQGSESNPSWPGLDWDVVIVPDPDVNYMAPDLQGDWSVFSGTEEIEIEHFAVPEPYRPQVGDWLQASGRWIVDCGHPDFHTEIHPPELMVSTKPITSNLVEVRAIATGAWASSDADFVVYAPPRPSAFAELKWSIQSDKLQRWKLVPDPSAPLKANLVVEEIDGAQIECFGVPTLNPNHLACELHTDNRDPLDLFNVGVVGMARNRGFQGIIRTWWDVPTESVSGTVGTSGAPAAGAWVFYRSTSPSDSIWSRVRVDSTGHYAISGLARGDYWFRPGGSGHDFLRVPRLVTLKDGLNTVSFSGAPPVAAGAAANNRTLGPAAVPPKFSNENPDNNSALWSAASQPSPLLQQPSGDPAKAARQDEARRVLQSFVLTINESQGDFGVKNNDLGLRENGTFLVHLAGLDNEDGQPVPDFWSAFSLVPVVVETPQGPKTTGQYIGINGDRGPGVAGATIHASLLLGNDTVGYRVGAEIPSIQTDQAGNVRLQFSAGSHVEEGVVAIAVVKNPHNPWLTPSVRGAVHLFQPAKTGDDSTNPIAYQLSSEAIESVRPSANGPILHKPDAVLQMRFLDSVKENEEFSTALRRLRKVPRPVPPAKQPHRIMQVSVSRAKRRDAKPSIQDLLPQAIVRPPYWIEATARDGVITLTGRVRNLAEKQEAEAVAHRTRGTIRVQNNLEVARPKP